MRRLRNFRAESAKDSFEQAKAKYSDMSEDQLIAELKRKLIESNSGGEEMTEQIKYYSSALSPYLTPEQKQTLQSVLDGIKGE